MNVVSICMICHFPASASDRSQRVRRARARHTFGSKSRGQYQTFETIEMPQACSIPSRSGMVVSNADVAVTASACMSANVAARSHSNLELALRPAASVLFASSVAAKL